MEKTYLSLDNNPTSPAALQLSKALDLVNAIQANIYADFVECQLAKNSNEIVIFDVEVELGQISKYDIRRHERIVVIFDAKDALIPQTFALRSDFPQVPHLLTGEDEYPRCLCLFEETYSELKLYWSGAFFLSHIREWLALTARGELHAEDQPLEPLLPYSNLNLILPSDLLTTVDKLPLISIQKIINSGGSRKTLIAQWGEATNKPKDNINYIVTPVRCQPQAHGVIHKIPKNVFDLHQFLQAGNIDLLEILRSELGQIDTNNAGLLTYRIILIVILPKTRAADSLPESYEFRAFLIDQTIREIGIDIGIWDDGFENKLGKLLLPDQTKRGTELPLITVNPVFALSKEHAKQLNGLETKGNIRITAVGAGALGSQVFMNLVRSGYGEWKLIDDDYLLPHNLGRHALDANWVGWPKSFSLAYVANQLIDGSDVAEGIVDNVLQPTDPDMLQKLFDDTEIILDMSASIAAARHLAHEVHSSARRISLFLNPMGTDLILLAEDIKREARLDVLEMQYYRHLLYEPLLENHLQRNQERIRYAVSCRDVSSTIAQEAVALHAAIGGRAIRYIVSGEEADISIWQLADSEIAVQRHRIPIEPSIEWAVGEWRLCTDQWLVDKIYAARATKLPSETGGVLIGSCDRERKIIYVVDTILSPSDSIEWPNVYIRGCQGLKHELDRIDSITAGRLGYIGEWHSHPKGFGTDPSEDDIKAFSWLTEVTRGFGLPALMMIAGDDNDYRFFVEQM